MQEDTSYSTTQLELVHLVCLDPEAERKVKTETSASCLPGSWGVLPRSEAQEVLGKWQPHLILGKLEHLEPLSFLLPCKKKSVE